MVRGARWRLAWWNRWVGRWMRGFIPLQSPTGVWWEDGLRDELQYFAPWLLATYPIDVFRPSAFQ